MSYAYPAFYSLGFFVAALVAWHLGLRSGLDARRWALLLAVTVVGGVIGSRVLHFDLIIGGFGDRTFLGGLVGGTLVFIAATRLLGLGARGADALAVAVPLGHAVGRIGCYVAGCCFGHPTTLPWAVQYGPGTEGHDAQVAAGLIAEGAAALAVHPVQVYEVGVQLVLAALAWRFASRFRRPGSAFLAVVGSYGVARAVLEGFRFDAWSQPGITTTQWLVALLAVAAFGWLIWRERRGERAAGPVSVRAGALLIGIAALPALLFLIRGEGFTPVELMVVAAAVAVAVPWALSAIRRMAATVAVAGAMPAVAGLLFLQLVSDTAIERRSYTTVGAAGSTGSYVETCGGARRVGTAGLSIAHTAPMGEETWVVTRAQGFAGSDEGLDIAGAGLSIAAEGRSAGFGIGLLAGSLTLDGNRESVYPTGHLRVGRRDRVFLEGHVAELDPVGIPIPIIRLGVGFGAGGGSTVGVGVSGSGFYGTALFVNEGWELEPFLAVSDAETYQFSLAIRKRLGGARPPRVARGAIEPDGR